MGHATQLAIKPGKASNPRDNFLHRRQTRFFVSASIGLLSVAAQVLAASEAYNCGAEYSHDVAAA